MIDFLRPTLLGKISNSIVHLMHLSKNELKLASKNGWLRTKVAWCVCIEITKISEQFEENVQFWRDCAKRA